MGQHSAIPELSALAASEEIRSDITHLIDIFTDGIMFLDREWRITYANESARKISRTGRRTSTARAIGGVVSCDGWNIAGADLSQVHARADLGEFMNFITLLSMCGFHSRAPSQLGGHRNHFRDISRLKRAEATRDESATPARPGLSRRPRTPWLCLIRITTSNFLNRRAQELLSRGASAGQESPGPSFPELSTMDSALCSRVSARYGRARGRTVRGLLSRASSRSG